jgi:hypothetical protein
MPMWAVVTTVRVPDDAEPASLRQALEREAAPLARSLPGFVRGMWTLSGDHRHGVGVVVFTDESHARARLAQLAVGSAGPGGATIVATDAYEVLAEA